MKYCYLICAMTCLGASIVGAVTNKLDFATYMAVYAVLFKQMEMSLAQR